jgi:glycosyltransferase involved in cell wall biosynthesis
MHILYQGLLRSPASWARVGRGYVAAFLDLGLDCEALQVRGFRHDPGFALPRGLRELSLAEVRARPEPDIGLGFLHPPLVGRLLGRRRCNLFVWEADVVPAAWVQSLDGGVDRVVVPSRFTRDALTRSGMTCAKIVVCPYGHDLGEPRLVEPRPEGRPFTFLAVMAPHRRKGVEVLLEAYRRAFREEDSVLLEIKSTYDPGAGRRRFPFEIPSWGEVLRASGLTSRESPRVEVDLRTVDDMEMTDLYRKADVYVQPSWGESFGLALLEAMASARPALATGWGGHMEFWPFRDDALPYRLESAGDALYESVPGARVAVPDAEALAARLRWHYEHPRESREIGLEARRAVAGMTWQESARRLLAALAGPEGAKPEFRTSTSRTPPGPGA